MFFDPAISPTLFFSIASNCFLMASSQLAFRAALASDYK